MKKSSIMVSQRWIRQSYDIGVSLHEFIQTAEPRDGDIHRCFEIFTIRISDLIDMVERRLQQGSVNRSNSGWPVFLNVALKSPSSMESAPMATRSIGFNIDRIIFLDSAKELYDFVTDK